MAHFRPTIFRSLLSSSLSKSTTINPLQRSCGGGSKLYWTSLLRTRPVVCCTKRMSGSHEDSTYRLNISNGLLVYHHNYSYYSQKVIMALHEKNLPFESQLINLIKMEQYSPWFLQLNPRGEVPVLQDTGKIIPDSSLIIDYLEDNFSNGDTPRLIPMDQGVEMRQKVVNFRNAIDQLPAGIITVGSFINASRVRGPKLPFIGPVRRLLANNSKKMGETLRKYAETNPEAREILLQKATQQEKQKSMIMDEEEYFKVLDNVASVLDKVENELALHTEEKENWWLCTNRFTIADIALTILLERLSQLGYESHFWTHGKRPCVEKYYLRVQERDSYKKTIPGMSFHIRQFLLTYQKPIVLGIGLVAAVAIIVSGALLVNKFTLTQ